MKSHRTTQVDMIITSMHAPSLHPAQAGALVIGIPMAESAEGRVALMRGDRSREGRGEKSIDLNPRWCSHRERIFGFAGRSADRFDGGAFEFFSP
jgi:hypothetical protein